MWGSARRIKKKPVSWVWKLKNHERYKYIKGMGRGEVELATI